MKGFGAAQFAERDTVDALRSDTQWHSQSCVALDVIDPANTPGIFSLVHEEGPNCFIIGDQYLNIFNSQAAFIYEEVGCSAITASCEMTWKQIERLVSLQKLPVEVVVAGKAELMITEYCQIAAHVGTGVKADARRVV